jgi:hypothetical protein
MYSSFWRRWSCEVNRMSVKNGISNDFWCESIRLLFCRVQIRTTCTSDSFALLPLPLPNMAYSYVVTSQRATTVNQSVVCSFTSPSAKNLVIAKGNYLLVYSARDDALELVLEAPLFGRIKCLDFYRPHGHDMDVLFLLTERKSFCVLGYDPVGNKLITRAVGNVRDRAGRDVEIGQRGIVDPEYRMIGMMLYEGQLKVYSLFTDPGTVIDVQLCVFPM